MATSLKNRPDLREFEFDLKNAERIEVSSVVKEMIGHAEIVIRGTSPLIMHKFSSKALNTMAEKQQQKGDAARVRKRDPKNPVELCLGATHFIGERAKSMDPSELGNVRYGFPASGFKRAIVEAIRQIKDSPSSRTISKALVNGGLHVIADDMAGNLVEIFPEHVPTMRTDAARNADGSTDIRWRPEFLNWGAKVRVTYNTKQFTSQQIIDLFEIAGYASGLGEWRPERGGSYGMWQVVSAVASVPKRSEEQEEPQPKASRGKRSTHAPTAQESIEDAAN